MRRRSRWALAIGLATGLTCLTAVPMAHGAKFTTITETKGAGGSLGGVPLAIPDGAGEQTQLVRSGIPIKQLNPRGKITDVNVAVRATHPQARDLEIYLATPRGVINLSSDNGGTGNNYGTGPASCGGFGTVFDSNVPTLISTPGLTAPFAGVFAPEEPLTLLNGLGGKKASNSKWSLLIEDDSNANPAGSLDCWGITIKATNPKPKG
jgi:hypothetical protein